MIKEKDLYGSILDITHYKSRGLKLIDYEDTDLLVEEQFDKLADIYRPLLKNVEPFKSSVRVVSEMMNNTNPLS